jgi:CpeT protein
MFSLLLFTACGEKDTSDTAVESIDTLSVFESQLSGAFDSSQQAQEDPTYYDVSLTACAVSVEGIDTPTLYIEQALSDKLNQPYRQRVYVLSQVQENVVKSEIYVLDNPNAYIGTCAEDEVRSVPFDSMTLKDGCAVELEWNGKGFVGGTDVGTCQSDMNGASYATSIVETTDSMILSWDQGWDSNDQQVWGAVDGAYIFLRR